MRSFRTRSLWSLALVLLWCGQAHAAEPLEVRITARQSEFKPGTITVRKGEPVRLLLVSEDADHTFVIDDFGIARALPANREVVVELTPHREGRFRFRCSSYLEEGHEQMSGELVVAAGSSPPRSGIQVEFDAESPGVVIVESNGERLRIDTTARTVERVAGPEAGVELVSRARRQGERPRPPSEPYDYRLVNVPTPKRVPKGSLNVYFTHRFSKPVHAENESFGDTVEELFGLDSFSVSSLAFMYGFTDRLYGVVHRSPICQPSPICKTIELGVGYRLLDEAGRSPLALTAYASVEGSDNFTEQFTYNIQAMMARSVTRHVNLFFSPAMHLNSNGQGRFNPRPESFFPVEPLAAALELGRHTGSFGFGANGRIRPSVSLLFEYTPRVGFKLGQIEQIFGPDFTRIGLRNKSEAEIGFGVEKRLGRHAFSLTFSNTQATTTSRYNSSNLVLPPGRVIIGFNLFRRLL